MGLAPQAGLVEQILAGPWHPALGQMARSRALFAHIEGFLAGRDLRPARLLIPRPHLSDILGHGREMLPAWAGLGLAEDRIRVWEHSGFGVESH
jgi:hypothetical protein